jgi:hypothetical protein
MTSRAKSLSVVCSWLGLLAGGSLWAFNTQAGQILPYTDCTMSVPSGALVSVSAIVIVALGSFVSWRSMRRKKQPHGDPAGPWQFAGFVSALSGAIFVFALALQTAAALMVNACDR